MEVASENEQSLKQKSQASLKAKKLYLHEIALLGGTSTTAQ
jgi:hypothetical protein